MSDSTDDAPTLMSGTDGTTAVGGGPHSPRKLRILRVVGDIYPERLGGGALHAHLLSARQADMGHDVTVLAPDFGNSSLPREDRRDGYRLVRHEELIRPFGNPVPTRMIRSLAEYAGEYDVVHAHSHLYFTTTLAAAVTRLRDVPLVLTNHGLYSQTAPKWVQRVYIPTVARLAFEAADRVLCYSETDRDRLRDIGVGSPISVVANGVDCERFAPDPTVEERDEVLFVGRLNRNKGPQRVLEAFSRIAGRRPETTLSVVGTGPIAEELQRESRRLGVADRVTFLGRVSNDRLPELYNRAKVFVLPSENEGFPRTVLEAMACGTPPVTSSLAQLAGIVDDVGRTVPVDDIESLTTAVEDLLAADSRRAALGRRARDLVEAEYSWSQTVSETTATYYSVLD